MKKILTMVLALLVVINCNFGLAAPVSTPEEAVCMTYYETTAIQYGDVELEVPVLKEITQTQGANSVIQDTSTIFVPLPSAEAQAYNAQRVNEINTYGAPISTYGYGDFYDNGYFIHFHSTLEYKTSYYFLGTVRYTMIDMISFKLDREVYTQAPFLGFKKATARAVQVGSIGDPAGEHLVEIMNQDKEYSFIEYSTRYSIPDEWLPVYSDYDGCPKTAVQYKVEIVPANGDSYIIEYSHQAV